MKNNFTIDQVRNFWDKVAEIYDESVCQCREKSTCEDRYAAAAFSYRSQLRMTGKWENEKI